MNSKTLNKECILSVVSLKIEKAYSKIVVKSLFTEHQMLNCLPCH